MGVVITSLAARIVCVVIVVAALWVIRELWAAEFGPAEDSAWDGRDRPRAEPSADQLARMHHIANADRAWDERVQPWAPEVQG